MDEHINYAWDEVPDYNSTEDHAGFKRPIIFLGSLAIAALVLGIIASAVRGDDRKPSKVVQAFYVKECNGKSCRMVRYEWRVADGHPRQHHLFRDGVQIGGWCYNRCVWFELDPTTGNWSKPKEKPPFDVPGVAIELDPSKVASLPAKKPTIGDPIESPVTLEPVGQNGVTENHGVDLSQIGNDRYTFAGRDCRRRDIVQAMASGQTVPDDSALKRLTVFGGSAADRAAVVRDLENHPALSEFKGKLLTQSYPADHWVANDPERGFKLGPGLTIYLQAPDGTEELRQEGYEGAEKLLDRLRPRKPADPDAPSPPRPLDGLRDFSALTAWLKNNWLAATLAAAVAVLLWRRAQK